LDEFLNQWLTQVVKSRVRKWTYTGYEVIVRRHINPRLGKVRLEKLTPAQVQGLLNEKLEAGLAPRTVRYVRQVLRTALGEAQRWGLVARNVADVVDGPRVERNEVEPMRPEEARRFLASVRGDRLEALYAVVLAVGLRQGEALGLRWQDVDLEKGTIRVVNQLQRVNGQLRVVPVKTARGRRSLLLPVSTIGILEEHWQRQVTEKGVAGRDMEGIRLGLCRPRWIAIGSAQCDPLVQGCAAEGRIA
jgi:integrase